MSTAAIASNPEMPFGLAGSEDNAIAARWGGNDNDGNICHWGRMDDVPRHCFEAVC